MCGIAGYSLARARASTGRWPRRRCWPRSPSAAPTPSATPTGRPSDAYADRRQAAHARVAAARAGRPCPDERNRAARPRPRLHEGPPVDRRQQPPGPARAGGRGPQRDHPERRRAPRRARLRARRAEHDRRLRGDLRASPPTPGTTRRALEALHGSMAAAWLDEREPERRPPRPRRRPAALARRGPRRRLLRLDRARARGRSSATAG